MPDPSMARSHPSAWYYPVLADVTETVSVFLFKPVVALVAVQNTAGALHVTPRNTGVSMELAMAEIVGKSG